MELLDACKYSKVHLLLTKLVRQCTVSRCRPTLMPSTLNVKYDKLCNLQKFETKLQTLQNILCIYYCLGTKQLHGLMCVSVCLNNHV